VFGNPDEILNKWREIEGGKEHKIEWNSEEYTKHINWIKGKVTEFLINSVLNPPDINAIESEKRQFSNIQHILLIGGYGRIVYFDRITCESELFNSDSTQIRFLYFFG